MNCLSGKLHTTVRAFTPSFGRLAVQASRLGLHVAGVTRTNLIREREELTTSPNLEILQNRGLSLDLRPDQTRPCVLLTRERDLRLGSVAGCYSAMI